VTFVVVTNNVVFVVVVAKAVVVVVAKAVVVGMAVVPFAIVVVVVSLSDDNLLSLEALPLMAEVNSFVSLIRGINPNWANSKARVRPKR